MLVSNIKIIGVVRQNDETFFRVDLDGLPTSNSYNVTADITAGSFNFNGSVDRFYTSLHGSDYQGKVEAVSGDTHSVLFRVPPGLVLPEVTVDNVLITTYDPSTGATSKTNFGTNNPDPTGAAEQPLGGPWTLNGEPSTVTLIEPTDFSEVSIQTLPKTDDYSGAYELNFLVGEFDGTSSNVNNIYFEATRMGSDIHGSVSELWNGFIGPSGISRNEFVSPSYQTHDAQRYVEVEPWKITRIIATSDTGSSKALVGENPEYATIMEDVNINFNVMSPNNSSGDMLNLQSIYVESGDYVNFDINHEIYENNISYDDIRDTWSDGYSDLSSWLTISETGVLQGYVPSDYNHSGGHVNWTYNEGPKTISGNSNFFDINQRFEVEEISGVRIGDLWTNSRMDGAVYFNSSDETLFSSSGQYIAAPHEFLMADGKSFQQQYYDQIRAGGGIDISTTFFDDYIDFSGYSATDFVGQLPFWGVRAALSPGDDKYLFPDIAITETSLLSGKSIDIQVGLLYAGDYFDTEWSGKLDSSDGLIFEFADGGVNIKDTANGYSSRADNVSFVTTSSYSNDIVYGDVASNLIMASGGKDTVYGGLGDDWFAIDFDDEDNGNSLPLNYNLHIKDYQSGEEISFLDFGIRDQSAINSSVIYDEESNAQTIFSIDTDLYGGSQILTVDGVWSISDSLFSTVDQNNLPTDEFIIALKSPYDISDPIIEGTSGSDHLAPYGNPERYDEGIQNYTQQLEIRGYEGWDRIAGGAGNDYLDGGEEAVINKYGRDINSNGELVLDKLYYID
ncbi:hypothetical protein OAT77_08090, partial [Alphaproteobacteria bacterium]|nr:hypothetical protein [Alphaproteobacteria bacterium]